jgi:hypothetical protein
MRKSKTPSTAISKEEALELLSTAIRNPKIETGTLIKLVSLYSKMEGWEKAEPAQPEEAIDMAKLIAAVEKKRKQI